jgi:hypothetical protein
LLICDNGSSNGTFINGNENESESDQGLECEDPYFGSEATGSGEANNGKIAHEFSSVKQ